MATTKREVIAPITLALLPMLDRVRTLTWTRAAMKGMGPAVIGVLAVSLVRLTPHAVPDLFAAAMMVATVVALLVWRVGAIKLVVAGSLLGIVRTRLCSLPGVKVTRDLTFWVRV